MHQPYILLVKESNPHERSQLAGILKSEEYRVIFVENNTEAINLSIQEKPHFIILDDLYLDDGKTILAEEILSHLRVQPPPVIFLATEKTTRYPDALYHHIDDFLLKPYDKLMLQAKLHMAEHIIDLKQGNIKQSQKINLYKRQILHEQEVSKKILSAISQKGALQSDELKYKLSSMALFEGNLLLCARKPTGDFNVLIGEFSGELFPAAVSALPMAEIFYGMTRKGFDMVEILTELNRRIKSILPAGIFFAVCFVDVNQNEQVIRAFNGGMPNGYLLQQQGQIKQIIERNLLPLGIIADEEIAEQIQIEHYALNDKIYLFSQNVINLPNKRGEPIGEAPIKSLMNACQNGDNLFDDIFNLAASHASKKADIEHMTFAELSLVNPPIDVESFSVISAKEGMPRKEDWHLQFELRPHSLRSFNPLPLVLHIIMECSALKSHHTPLFTIIAELFSNALEHGVLGLDSQMKATPEGFTQYYEKRDTLLSTLKNGYVRFDIEHHTDGQQGQLTLTLEDSGEGFDYATLLKKDFKTEGYSGRGLPLIRSLCDSIHYTPPGNRVSVVYSWSVEEA